jgi:hypothetical protein
MLVATAVILVATAALGVLGGHRAGVVLLSVLLTVACFQASYLVGVFVSVIWRQQWPRGPDR